MEMTAGGASNNIAEIFTDLSVWAGIRNTIERVNTNALAA